MFLNSSAQRGFSLIEVAMVLVIIGLVAGILLPTQQHSRRISHIHAAQDELKTVRDALTAYVLMNGRLPCAANTWEESDTNGGKESRTGTNCATGARYLPWRDLGVSPRDRWDNPYYYRVDTNFAKAPINLGTLANDDLKIEKVFENSTQVVMEAKSVAAVVFSTGEPKAQDSPKEADNKNPAIKTIRIMDDLLHDPDAPNHDQNVNDIVLWISVLPLKNDLIRAGKI